MNRLYYDCPIEAEYMREKFNVKTYAKKLGVDKYYIKKESLPIFEPMENDLITADDIFSDGAALVQKDDNNNAFVRTGGFYETDDYYIKNLKNVEIIQRNNKPFITPKREEV